jgi:D-alanyl-lipoteichoic acid acyltransferase DltB (MBOAT superfamily)
MVFNSLSFLIFFPIVAFLYYVIPKKFQWILLLVCSCIFYLYAGPKFIVFILVTTTTTYFATLWIGRINTKQQNQTSNESQQSDLKNQSTINFRMQKKLVLLVTLILNIGILLFLKYYNFFAHAGNSCFKLLHISANLALLNLFLPLGISFYTLQAVGYCMDIYRNKYQPEKNIAKYALFLSFFPQILQGPIGRYDSLAPQLYKSRTFNYDNVKFGFQLMVWGFFKKLVIADRLGISVNQVFDNFNNYTGYQILIASVFYAIQIYADFSGCMDIASGAAQVLGIQIMQNFNMPYFAKSIQDFWRRWHISLSSWLRDYLYIPLGGNRKGIVRKYVNVIIVFFVSGIWHGVGLHYVVWGLLHGFYQVIGALLMPARNFIVKIFKIDRQSFSHKLYKVIVTFLLVDFAWIFFRATNLSTALLMIKSMYLSIINGFPVNGLLYSMGLNQTDFNIAVISIFVMLMVSALQRKIHIRETLAKQNLPFRWLLYFVGVCSVIILGMYGATGVSSAFIYYKF